MVDNVFIHGCSGCSVSVSSTVDGIGNAYISWVDLNRGFNAAWQWWGFKSNNGLYN